MDGNESAPRFPLPSEIADAPGAEGWRSMYPYFTRFQPDARIGTPRPSTSSRRTPSG
jgi:hypothetical protein